MFRPFQLLQIIVVALALAGCAGSSSESRSLAADSTPPTEDSSLSDIIVARQQDLAATPDRPPRPRGAPGDFLTSTGQLQAELEDFARQLAEENDIPRQNVQNLLYEARYADQAARLMTPSGRRIRRAWHSYRKRHVDPIRIRRGIQFWHEHRQVLQSVSARTGVPAEIIVSIIGIETVYGSYTGDHRVLDTLTTLGFRYPDPKRPERQQMFRQQLADLILLDHKGWLDARHVRGSYAGAMGLPQFLPGSLMRYAVDGDGDGRIDLHHSVADAIASVGAYLQGHGWVAGVPVFAPVSLPANPSSLVQDGLEPATHWSALQAAGARSHENNACWQQHPLGVIDLQDEIRQTHDYRCATTNFFVLTKYNRSYFYASAVADLAKEIAAGI